MSHTGSCFRRDESGALIECRSFVDDDGIVWTEEILVEPAPVVEPE